MRWRDITKTELFGSFFALSWKLKKIVKLIVTWISWLRFTNKEDNIDYFFERKANHVNLKKGKKLNMTPLLKINHMFEVNWFFQIIETVSTVLRVSPNNLQTKVSLKRIEKLPITSYFLVWSYADILKFSCQVQNFFLL